MPIRGIDFSSLSLRGRPRPGHPGRGRGPGALRGVRRPDGRSTAPRRRRSFFRYMVENEAKHGRGARRPPRPGCFRRRAPHGHPAP